MAYARFLISCVLVAGIACKKERSLGSVALARDLGRSAGCDLPAGTSNSTCSVSIGPCNCRLGIQTIASGDGSDRLELLDVVLYDCPWNGPVDRILPILDPFMTEEQRTSVHALISKRPEVTGADEFSTISVHRTIDGTRVEAEWKPTLWSAVDMRAANNRPHIEQTLGITLKTSSTELPEETTATAADVRQGVPPVCRDGLLRPWESPRSER